MSSAFGRAFTGTETKTKQKSTESAEQKRLSQAINQGLKNRGPLKDVYGKFNKKEFKEGVSKPALKQYEEEILPKLLEQNNAGGYNPRSSGAQRRVLKSGTDFSSNIARLMYEARQGQKANRQQGIQTQLGRQTTENIVYGGKKGIFQKFGESFAEGAGEEAGSRVAGKGSESATSGIMAG